MSMTYHLWLWLIKRFINVNVNVTMVMDCEVIDVYILIYENDIKVQSIDVFLPSVRTSG